MADDRDLGAVVTPAASFASFCALERGSGGPDHHLRTIVEIARSRYEDLAERAWCVACYVAPYNVPAGLAILERWPLGEPLDGLEAWLAENWGGIPIRKEKRAVRSPAKMVRHLRDLRSFSRAVSHADASVTFDRLWSWVSDGVWGVGRYSACKLLEGLRRAGVTADPQPDMRPHGAKYPRRSLALLFPDSAEQMRAVGTSRHDGLADDLARESIRWSRAPDIFTAEVLLCDWQQALRGSYYPGRPLDSELDQVRTVAEHFGTDLSEVFDARRVLFPVEHLGEVQGWDGRRKELGGTMEGFGYWWSDRKFDYLATADLDNPVWRSGQC